MTSAIGGPSRADERARTKGCGFAQGTCRGNESGRNESGGEGERVLVFSVSYLRCGSARNGTRVEIYLVRCRLAMSGTGLINWESNVGRCFHPALIKARVLGSDSRPDRNRIEKDKRTYRNKRPRFRIRQIGGERSIGETSRVEERRVSRYHLNTFRTNIIKILYM